MTAVPALPAATVINPGGVAAKTMGGRLWPSQRRCYEPKVWQYMSKTYRDVLNEAWKMTGNAPHSNATTIDKDASEAGNPYWWAFKGLRPRATVRRYKPSIRGDPGNVYVGFTINDNIYTPVEIEWPVTHLTYIARTSYTSFEETDDDAAKVDLLTRLLFQFSKLPKLRTVTLIWPSGSIFYNIYRLARGAFRSRKSSHDASGTIAPTQRNLACFSSTN